MQLRDIQNEVARRGAQIVVVGNGTAWQAVAVKQEMRLPFTLVADPRLRSYAVARLHRGVSRLFDPRLLFAFWRAWRGGARQAVTQGDPLQLGGTLVFDARGRLRAHHRGAYPGDHWPSARILVALEQAASGS